MSSITLKQNSHELAIQLKVAKASGNRKLEEEIIVELTPHVRSTATFCARGLGPTQAQEFIGGSMSLVWERIDRFDPQQSRFSTWSNTVLRNEKINWLRKNARRPRVDTDIVDVSFCNFVDKPGFWDEPFTRIEIDFIGRWAVRARVELLSIWMLDSKLPRDLWNQWLAEYENEFGVRLPSPFPNTRCMETNDRISMFCFGNTKQDAIRMFLRRKKESLLMMIPLLRESIEECI
jgi:RNA polymerase sigma factor (sigma-70 family)